MGGGTRIFWGTQRGGGVAVSCAYGTCFAVRICDGLYHFIFFIDCVGIRSLINGPPIRVRFRESLVLSLHSEIDQIHLSIGAQCVTTLLPLGDCHRGDQFFQRGDQNCLRVTEAGTRIFSQNGEFHYSYVLKLGGGDQNIFAQAKGGPGFFLSMPRGGTRNLWRMQKCKGRIRKKLATGDHKKTTGNSFCLPAPSGSQFPFSDILLWNMS